MIVMERASTGEPRPLEVDAWHEPATPTELDLLAGLLPPVIDIGCGPGRIATALARRGIPALGIDVSPAALAVAAASGATVLDRSVFDPLPGEGRWGAALLLDGNVGIGGDPTLLLRRVRHLLRVDGEAVVEVDAPGRPTIVDHVRLRCPSQGDGPWFGWAWVGADAIDELAASAGFGDCVIEHRNGRHFARLHQRGLP